MHRDHAGRLSHPPEVFIRADGNSEIGLGHIMRTGALAAELRRQGAEVTYITRYPQYISDYQTATIPPDLTMAAEPAWIGNLIARCRQCQALVVDHYGFDQAGLNSLAAIPGLTSLIIDDMNLFEYNSSLLLNQNAYAPDLDIRGSARCLLGTPYLLLREEFSTVPVRKPAAEVRNVLITMGAADPFRLTPRVMNLLDGYPGLKACTWHVIIGPACAHENQIRALAADQPAFVLHPNPASVKELMLFCDISICAAGSSTYELAACGVPSLLLVSAENQRRVAEAAAARGWSRNLGDGAVLNEAILWNALDQLMYNSQERAVMILKGQTAIDGKGAVRVAQELLDWIRRR